MNPTDAYLESMKMFCPEIKDEEIAEFSKALILKNFGKRDNIFGPSVRQDHVVYVHNGLARAYYIDEKVMEKTSWFIQEGEFITDYPAFLNNEHSNYIFEALEPIVSVWLPKDAIERGYETHASLQKYGRLVVEHILKWQYERISGFLFKTAKERYLDFLEQHPNLTHRISQAHLASYIGIERQSLTRIRKAVLLEEKS